MILSIFILGCTPPPTVQDSIESRAQSLAGRNQSIPLNSVEITEYEGKQLDTMENVLDVSIKGPQYVDINKYQLEVVGLVESPKKYSYEEVLALQEYSKLVTLHCVMGWSATVLWEGVLLKDLFNEVKVKPEANTVIFYAYDGYTTSLPLSYILDNNIILADKINNVTLVPERGFPFELVAEDKYGYKWIKWVTKIEISDDLNYKGYWEKRGYDNNADIN
ncbi:MAG: molybdopterin-dependent oxidoreductase [Nanoarchaeota archaeon]|nr:molybdopterin-dependent oxidoreductase [Nanoarchaeota archaeon]MBU1005709.1 molybdopterin-dependent oxidoreductase [Nanoarchaeota archaeon]